MESQFDPGEGPRADLPADLVEAHPATYHQVLDGILVLAHVGGEPLQGGERRRRDLDLLVLDLLVLWADVRAVRQAVEAVVALGGHLVLVLFSRHVCSRVKIII